MNSLYNQLSKQPMNPMQMLQELRNNPTEVLRQRGFNVPDGMNDPNQIIQHLVSSGQINGNRLAQVQQMANSFRM